MRRWKVCRLLGLGVCCFLLAALLVTGALAQSNGPYQVAGGTISGGGYRLTIANEPVGNVSHGGGYHLLGPDVPGAPPIGCCCTYLPCLMRQP